MFIFKRNSKEEKTKWHLWFAWFPVVVDYTPDGDMVKVWFEYVYRCGREIEFMEGNHMVFIHKVKEH